MGFEGCIQGRKNVKRKNLASVSFYLQKRGEIFLRKFFPCSNSLNFAYLRPVFVQDVLALTLGSKSGSKFCFPPLESKIRRCSIPCKFGREYSASDLRGSPRRI